MFSDRINRIQPSLTLQMTSKAGELRSKGFNVINLSVGEPDFDTPENIRNAGINAINSGKTRYTPGAGMPILRQAACEKMERDNSLFFKPEEVIISCGGKHSLYNACQVLFQSGDEVIIFKPYWVSFPDFVSVTGAKPVFVNTNPESQFEPDFEDLINSINPNTKGIIINSPSNPTGGVWSDDAVKQTLEIAKKHNLWVFSDECYEQLTYDVEFKSIATLTNDNEKILTFQSCSKTYAMTGWRIGYTAGNSKVIKAMSKLQGQSTSCPNSIAQMAAVEALTGNQEAIPKMREIFKSRRTLIMERLKSIIGVNCAMPGGAFYVFPDFTHFIGKILDGKTINTATDIAMYLLENKQVVSVPGDGFGSPNNIRFSYAASDQNINDAIDALENVLNKIN
ncbi:MAG: pyridoxal phosphate-dependent aminotransferase [Candidatus Marinimicrobia bacterium]|nr:pyridoxal phosphate-dependent aminotransferase [Candidatus Neomarinimicrobiota bacterium]